MSLFQRPRPVLTQAGFNTLATSVAGILSFLGLNDAASVVSAESASLISVGIAAVSAFVHFGSAIITQMHTAPMSDPAVAAAVAVAPATVEPVSGEDVTVPDGLSGVGS